MSITKFNINADFIAYQQITASGLSHLSGRAYKTEGGIFALCSKGSLKTIINHTEYRIGVNELIVVPPETFVQLLTASDDVEIHAVMFSQRLIQNAGMGKNMMDKFHIIGKHYVFSLSEMVSQLYSEMFTFLSHLYKEVGEKLSVAVVPKSDVAGGVRTLSGTGETERDARQQTFPSVPDFCPNGT